MTLSVAPCVGPLCRVAAAGRRLSQLGQTEIENLDAAIVGDEHVLGLDVSVDDAFFVRGGEPVATAIAVFDGFTGDQRAVAEQVAKRLALQEFADDVGRAFVRADVVDRKDVRMVQRCSGAGFLLEAPEPVGIRRVDVAAGP